MRRRLFVKTLFLILNFFGIVIDAAMALNYGFVKCKVFSAAVAGSAPLNEVLLRHGL